MGNFNFTVPSLGSKFIDYRHPILGDSFNWSWVRPMSQVKYLTIHHTAGPDTQTPDDIANFHVNSRGWGGIGYHFVITKDGRTYYVGDLTTARAHVLNRNHEAIGICLIGSFIDGREPTHNQFTSAHQLCAQLLFRTPALPNTNGWEDVVGHKQLGSTRCPGDAWEAWRGSLLAASPPPPPAPQPSPAPQPPNLNERRAQITQLYQVVLGRDPDQSGLDHYTNGNFTIENIRKIMTESQEHADLINRSKQFKQARELAQDALGHLRTAQTRIEQILTS